MNSHSILTFLQLHQQIFIVRLLQHIYLSLSATLCAILIGVPLGVWITRQPKVRGFILGITNITQTIPSLALLALLIPLLGIGIKPTIVALTVYALLPITRNTFTGINSVPEASLEAAEGLGFTSWQRLRLIEIPLALPIIMAGIRTATAMTIGITTIAAFIGAGGLGDFITTGLSLDNTRLILLGAIPTAILALTLDFIMSQLEVCANPRLRQNMAFKKIKFGAIGVIMAVILTSFGSGIYNSYFYRRSQTIIVASKNFTEQYILADMMADLIRAKTHLHVIVKQNLGTTAVLQKALEKGAIDLYPAYTGTGYVVVLGYKKVLSATKTYDIVKQQYQKRLHLTWLKPFGFYNSQTLALKTQFAKQHNLKNLSDLTAIAPRLTLAAPAEFIKRPDSFPGLSKVYRLKFRRIKQLQPDLLYQAINSGAVNIIEVFTTDARIQTYHLTALKDDKHFYPPYYAAPVVRTATLKAHPQLASILNSLAGMISTNTMRQLNEQVDVGKRSPKSVAASFLKQHHLIDNN